MATSFDHSQQDHKNQESSPSLNFDKKLDLNLSLGNDNDHSQRDYKNQESSPSLSFDKKLDLMDLSLGNDNTSATAPGASSGSIEREHMFDKVVTPSDVGKLNRLVIPKQHAEKYFPLDSSSYEKGLLLNFEDRNGKQWRFRYSYWNSSQSYVMTKGWSRFVKEKKLDAGDIVSFQRGIGESGKHRLYIDWIRRPNAPYPTSFTHLELPNQLTLTPVVRWGRLYSLPHPLSMPRVPLPFSCPLAESQADNSKELEDMMKRVKENEEEAGTLGELQAKVEKEMGAVQEFRQKSLSSTESESMLLDAIVESPELPIKTYVGEKRNREIPSLEMRESRFQHLVSWKLFEDNVGQVVDRRFIRPLAQEVVSLCCDHSDAIILMAGALKDASVADIWIKALQTLRTQPGPDQEKLQNLTVNVLKFSYGRLPDDRTRECLRHCIFLCGSSGNTSVSIHFLIESWMLEGLVSVDEGFRILETLISFNLLIRVDNSFVRMKKETRHVLLEHIVLPEERLLFMIQSSKGLIKPPEVEEWQRFKGIYLMDNKLSELPNNPHCPKLHSLFLERNFKLRIIPSSFFDNMPKLQVLNLSRTSIKSLPESLFGLVNLRRLFLNHCKLITSLSPKVGELKQLELLDLEGTEIMYLPIEVGQLTKLTCLEVSFFEPMSKRISEQASAIVPCGVISSLSKLEELHFDVSPDDRRWSAAAAEAIVSEVSKLQALSTLKFYFPKVELLSYFKWDSTRIFSLFPSSSYTEIESLFPFPTFSCFRVTVGCIAERVISRIPCDAEFELERYDKYLKYVNGEGIPEDIKKVLKLATAFFIDRHSTVRTFFEFGYMNMLHLKCCVGGECNELQVIVDGDQIEMESSSEAKFFLFSLEYLYIYHMKNLRSIWKGPVNSCSLCSLKSLSLHTCIELTTIFTPGLLSNFIKLEELTIDGCPKITSLISYDGSEYEISCILPALKRMSLHFLPNLAGISNGVPISPRLELMSFCYCKNLKSLPINKDFNVELRKIKGELSWWRGLKWEGTQQDSWDNIFEAVDKLK